MRENLFGPLPELVPDSENQYIVPVPIIEAVRDAFGGVIDLDPASDEEANNYVLAQRYITEKEDGLDDLRSWAQPNGQPSRVWINVTWRQLKFWLEKLRKERALGHVSEAIVMAENRMQGNDYLVPFMVPGVWHCQINGYQPFQGKGQKLSSSMDRQFLIYFGSTPERFVDAVNHLGFVSAVQSELKPWKRLERELELERRLAARTRTSLA